jgi:hypothetical protein
LGNDKLWKPFQIRKISVGEMIDVGNIFKLGKFQFGK